MTKRVPPELQALIDASVDADQFDSADELIKATHTKLEDPSTQEAVRNAWLKRQLERADAEGGELTIEEVFDPLEKRARDRIAKLSS